MLLPFGLFGQNDFVRMIVTAEGEVQFMRDQQKLWVSSITSPPVYEADYYVATWGNDDDPGTFSEPFASLDKAFSLVVAGDTVYVRGGTYFQPNPTDDHLAFVENRDGSAGNLICIFNYPGETPVFNANNCTATGENNGIYLYRCDYWHLKGLHVTGVQHGTAAQPYAIRIRGLTGTPSTNITIENCVAYANEGIGIQLTYTDDCIVLNCDAYFNDDPVGFNNGNGFVVSYTNISTINSFKGCRAWNNSWGEGFGCWAAEGIVSWDSCWSWNNTGIPGDGGGFELGLTYEDPDIVTQRFVRNCIAVNNVIGFNQASANVIMELYNNIAYLNDMGYYLDQYANAITTKNNISYDNDEADSFGGVSVSSNNDWDSEVTVTDADFVSLDVNQLDNPRQADGSLPVVTYLHLVEGSDLIDAGVDVGLDYEGAAPDIGYAESNY